MIFDLSLAFLTISSVFLSNSENNNERKYAPILGLTVQPFWFYTAYTSSNLGILLVTAFLSVSWFRGFYHQWLKIKPDVYHIEHNGVTAFVTQEFMDKLVKHPKLKALYEKQIKK